eukprot:SAG11_NODE_32_length_22830_cov_17.507941_3_plen_116_part_00
MYILSGDICSHATLDDDASVRAQPDRDAERDCSATAIATNASRSVDHACQSRLSRHLQCPTRRTRGHGLQHGLNAIFTAWVPWVNSHAVPARYISRGTRVAIQIEYMFVSITTPP